MRCEDTRVDLGNLWTSNAHLHNWAGRGSLEEAKEILLNYQMSQHRVESYLSPKMYQQKLKEQAIGLESMLSESFMHVTFLAHPVSCSSF